ncbi:MAG: thiamine pyrophosphate-requiring protein [Candidatus Bathyarchaeia archaeon]
MTDKDEVVKKLLSNESKGTVLKGLTKVQKRATGDELAYVPAPPLSARSTPETVSVENWGQAFVETTVRCGVKYWFVNSGTDWPVFIDAIAKRHALGKEWPKLLTVPHEFTATSMAMGYAQVNGEPQIVGYHVTVGTYNALGAIVNAFTGRVPILLFAGRRSITKEGFPGADKGPIAQESTDQAGPLREYIKWDYEIKLLEHIPQLVQRSLQIAKTEPKGPVYLSIPNELAMMEASEITIPPKELYRPAAPPHGDPIATMQAAELLVEAENPIIITRFLGANPAAVNQLLRFAELLAIPVSRAISGYMNFPNTHPLATSISLEDADVIFTIDTPDPWRGSYIPNPEAKYINLSPAPLRIRPYPMAGHYPADVNINGDPATTLVNLYQAASRLISRNPGKLMEVKERLEEFRVLQDAKRKKAVVDAMKVKNDEPIDRKWLEYCISQVKDDDTIIVDRSASSYVEYTKPGTYFGGYPAGCLGYPLGQALGVKLAAPDKTVICGMGDGSYIYGIPTAAHFTSAKYNLPVLYVIFNNQCWRAVRSTLLREYPDGWAVRTNSRIGQDLTLADGESVPHYELNAVASGGYGEMVMDPARLPDAFQDALHAVKVEKRQALLNVVIKYAT